MRGSGSMVTVAALAVRRRDRPDVEHRDRRSREIGKVAGAGQRILAPRDRLFALGAHGGDLVLDQAAVRAPAATPPAASISWNSAQAAAQSLSVRSSMRAGAGGRIGDLGEIGFLQQHELRVARDAARESGRAGRARR